MIGQDRHVVHDMPGTTMDEFLDFVNDCEIETDDYKSDVMTNQFVKANAANSAGPAKALAMT